MIGSAGEMNLLTARRLFRFALFFHDIKKMTPEEVVLQLKRNGTFDDLRKRLLTEFQNGVSYLLLTVAQHIKIGLNNRKTAKNF